LRNVHFVFITAMKSNFISIYSPPVELPNFNEQLDVS